MINQRHRRILEQPRWSPLRVVHDLAAGRSLRLCSDACKLEGERVGEGLMAVVTVHKYRSTWRYRVDPLSCWQSGIRLLLSPVLLVPIATENPFALWGLFCLLANAADKLFFRACVVQLHLIELHAA